MEGSLVACDPNATESKFTQLCENSASVTFCSDRLDLFSASDFMIVEKDKILYDSKLVSEAVLYTKIDTLINFNYKLKIPFEVKITKQRGEVIGEIVELELYAFGSNEFEVLRELNQDLTEMCKYLSSKKNENLGKFPLQWKRILLSHIVK
ncbi:MAG: hypothetical protein L6416_12235 [Candidatus Omnitrophica bacterium]|nr:hypothetical protein [Candidatus Omnitrophota bacterium]